MKRFKNALLWCAILWFVVAALWVVIIALRLSLLQRWDWLAALQVLVVALSTAAGLMCLRRWRRGKRETTSEKDARETERSKE